MGGKRPLVVVEGDPSADTGLGLRAGVPSVQVDALISQRPPQALDENVVEEAPFPFHRDTCADRFSRSVQAKDVNCEPCLVLMISGGPKRWSASFSASRQKSASSVFEMR